MTLKAATYPDFRRLVSDLGTKRPLRRTVQPVLPPRLGPPAAGRSGPASRTAGAGCCTSVVLVPPICPPYDPSPDDQRQQENLTRAVVQAFYETPPIIVQSSPREDPGYVGRSTIWTPPGGVVILTSSGTGSQAAGDALFVGTGGPWAPPGTNALNAITPVNVIPVLTTPPGVGSLWTLLSPDNRTMVVRGFSVQAKLPSLFYAVQFSIEVAGEQVVPWFSARPGTWFPIAVSVPPGASLTVKAMNFSSNIAAVIGLALSGWTIPVPQLSDEVMNQVGSMRLTNPISSRCTTRSGSSRGGCR